MTLLQDGQSIRNTYEVERMIGEGAFAEVYRVRHRFLGRQAMKVFKAVGMTIEEIEDLLGEAILLSSIGHPNIIRVFDANVTETARGVCGFFTTEYVAGGNLEQFWRSHGIELVPIETVVEIARQVCRGLAVAHAKDPPVVHRDIKPQNILVGYEAEGLRARVSDFGLAKSVNPLTMMASSRGTISFKAPEALLDPQADSTAADVWAVGSTIYLLLTDRLPYAGSGGITSVDPSTFDRPIIPPSRLNVRADPFLDQIIMRTLDRDPCMRYETVEGLLKDLEAWSPPGAARRQPKAADAATAKSALGLFPAPDEGRPREMVQCALEMATEAGRVNEAADLMEEAFNLLPELRQEYEYQLKLWRRGLTM